MPEVSGWRLQPWIQGESFLDDIFVEPVCLVSIDDQVPTVPGNSRWNEDAAMVSQEIIAVHLLVLAGSHRGKPVRVRDISGLDHADP